jgi:hypothetical protein
MYNIYDFLMYIIISLVILLLIKYYCCNENFAASHKHKNKHVDPLHKFVGHDKIINLTTTFSGTKYVLSSYPKQACSNYDKLNECLSNVLVLVDLDEHQQNIANMQQKREDDEKICQMKHQIKCHRDVKKKHEGRHSAHHASKHHGAHHAAKHHGAHHAAKHHDAHHAAKHHTAHHAKHHETHHATKHHGAKHHEKFENIEGFAEVLGETHSINNNDTMALQKDLDECTKTPPECVTIPNHNSDFTLVKVRHHDKKSKIHAYKLIGRVVGPDNSFMRHAISMAGEYSTLDLVCLDGGTLDNNPFSTLELIEVPNKSGPEPKFILRLAHHVLIGGKHPLHDKHGHPVLEYKYIGLCKNNTCDMNNKKYHRLCLYDKENNPFVLEFQANIAITASGEQVLE